MPATVRQSTEKRCNSPDCARPTCRCGGLPLGPNPVISKPFAIWPNAIFTLPMISAPRSAGWRRFAARSSSGDGGSSPVRNAARAWRQGCVVSLHSMLCLAQLTEGPSRAGHPPDSYRRPSRVARLLGSLGAPRLAVTRCGPWRFRWRGAGRAACEPTRVLGAGVVGAGAWATLENREGGARPRTADRVRTMPEHRGIAGGSPTKSCSGGRGGAQGRGGRLALAWVSRGGVSVRVATRWRGGGPPWGFTGARCRLTRPLSTPISMGCAGHRR
jgi:hypothetical protein